MADTTLTSTAVKSTSYRNIHAGVFAVIESITLTATPSASQIMLMIPIPGKVTVLDGWVQAAYQSASFTWDLMVGWVYDHSFFRSPTEVLGTNIPVRFNKNLGHVVTLTDSDTVPLAKPLAVTVAVAASGTLATTPVVTVMALLQNG